MKTPNVYNTDTIYIYISNKNLSSPQQNLRSHFCKPQMCRCLPLCRQPSETRQSIDDTDHVASQRIGLSCMVWHTILPKYRCVLDLLSRRGRRGCTELLRDDKGLKTVTQRLSGGRGSLVGEVRLWKTSKTSPRCRQKRSGQAGRFSVCQLEHHVWRGLVVPRISIECARVV